MLDPVELAQALIRRPSVTPKDEGAIDVLTERLEALGFACERLVFSEPGTDDVVNLYARLGTARPVFAFAGHTDVVPTGPREAWSVDPFEARLENGDLIGRGAADMKGAIAAFVAGVEQFLGARGREVGGAIAFLITGDEEGASINGTKKLMDWLEARGETLDACVVGEPTGAKALGDMVKVGRRGSMTLRVTVHGTQGHTAYPHLADNAAHRLVAMLHAITADPMDDGSAHFQPSTLQVSTIDIGNPASNIIPGEARATFNVRFNDLWTSAKVRGWVEERFARVAGRYTLDVSVSGESFLTPPGRVSEVLTRATEKVLGRKPELSTTGGTSDARFIHRFCPVAELGLVGLTMHKANERVPVADIRALAEVYRSVLDLFFAPA